MHKAVVWWTQLFLLTLIILHVVSKELSVLEHHFLQAVSAPSWHHVIPSVQICASSRHCIHTVHACLLLAH